MLRGRSFSEKPGDYMAGGVIMREIALPYMVIVRLLIYSCSLSENIGFPTTPVLTAACNVSLTVLLVCVSVCKCVCVGVGVCVFRRSSQSNPDHRDGPCL